MSGTALLPPVRLSLEAVARSTHLHPEQLRRLVILGVIDAEVTGTDDLSFAPTTLAAVGRIQRLRAGLGLDYMAAGLVARLLSRIEVLERALGDAAPRERGRPAWIRTD